MRKKSIVVIALFISFSAFGQGKYTLLQTNTFHDLIGNPNLHIEKHLGGPASLSLEMMYTSRSWSSNGEEIFGAYYPASGFLIGLAPRLYFPMQGCAGCVVCVSDALLLAG